MTSDLAWAVRPKWHRLESPQSYARRQCAAAGVPFDYAERGLTSSTQPYLRRVWADDSAAGTVVEAAAGRATGHYERLRNLAQPDPTLTYPERFLCRLCAGGEVVTQLDHDRENWCLRHAGQMVWVGPGTTPESQLIVPLDKSHARAERRFQRMVRLALIDTRLHARVWEMVRDNAWLTKPDGWTPALAALSDDREVGGRATLYPLTVAVLEMLSDTATVSRWQKLHPDELRDDIATTLPPSPAPVEVLVERIVLWLRPLRRKTRPTRLDPLCVPLDMVDPTLIIDTTGPYPAWIQRHPGAVSEWDWSRNGPARDPWDAPGVSSKAWWVCDQGHSWEARPIVRGQAGAGCPYCSGHAVWPGHTDLATVHPALAAEWDNSPGANAGDPEHVSANSHRRIAWRCRAGHQWVATVNNRSRTGGCCPICGNWSVLPGYNDLASTHPDLAIQWHQCNAKTAQEVTAGSAYRATWKCGTGHTWQAPVIERARRGVGCPFCSNRFALSGFNDLATLNPELAAQWDATPGVNDRTPADVTRRSQHRAGWRCSRGHAWRATVTDRAAGHGCPTCARRRIAPAGKELSVRRPELCGEWDFSNGLTPHQVYAFSNKKYTWRCPKGHLWEAKVSDRSRGQGCPFCSGRRVIAGETDLATLRPELALEWDTSNELMPTQVTPFSNKRVGWLCATGHRWNAIIANRSKGKGCPYCSGRRT